MPFSGRGHVVKRSGTKGLSKIVALMALCLSLAAAARLPAQLPSQTSSTASTAAPNKLPTTIASTGTPIAEPLRWKRNLPGDSRPIQLSADTATSWTDQGKRVVLLKGKAMVEQGDLVLRGNQIVVWVDEAAKAKTSVYHVTVYSEGGCSLDVGTQITEAPLGAIELNTRGTFKFGTYDRAKNPVAATALPDDPLLLRANDVMAGLEPLKTNSVEPGTIQQAVYQGPTAVPGQGNIQTVQAVQPPALVQPPAPPTGSTAPLAQPAVPPMPKLAPGSVMPEQTSPVLERTISIGPRSSAKPDVKDFPPTSDGLKATVISPGVIITIREIRKDDPTKPRTTVIAADRVVVYTKGNLSDLVQGLGQTPGPDQSPQAPHNDNNQLEFYLSGNVEISNKVTKEGQRLEGKEAYYNVNTSVALILDAVITIDQPALPYPIHLFSPEIRKVNEILYTWDTCEMNGSTLPYGPGLEVNMGTGTMEEKRILKKSIFGNTFIDPKTGLPEIEDMRLIKAYNSVIWLEGVPIFYFPYFQADATDPLGPLHSLSGGYSTIFGAEIFVTWSLYDLLGIDPGPGTHWYLNTDYMSNRGPALGTDFSKDNYNNANIKLFDIPGKWMINVKAYGGYDTGTDQIGGSRGTEVIFGSPFDPLSVPITHPDWRGRFLSNINWQEMPNGFSVQAQVAAISDQNYLDQYFNPDWITGPNEETYVYVKQQKFDWAWTALAEVNDRNWVTETQWLPKLDGYLIGQDFLDSWLTYTGHVSAGYAILQTTHQLTAPVEATDVNTNTGRFDIINEVDMPLHFGPFTVVPYAVMDLAYYTEDVDGNSIGRVYGGGGVRGSFPLSRLYSDVHSELLNVNGIYHKIVISEDFFWAHSSVSYALLPQLDRLNDDASDQALRDITPQQISLNPTSGAFLVSGFFDPQLMAIRKLVMNDIDTLDSIEVFTLDLRQRWQTKRGIPGQEHIVDWMTLDVSASFFPQANQQDNGDVVNFIQYDWTWAIGDRTTLFSSGWFDPHPDAARLWEFGAETNRPDGSSLSLIYRQIDPLNSKEVTASINIPFSSKYSISASTSWDFGVNTQNNTVTINRKGTDLTMAVGFSYDTILNTTSFIFELYPNLLPASAVGGANLLNSGLAQGR
jgi:hypothetical protein